MAELQLQTRHQDLQGQTGNETEAAETTESTELALSTDNKHGGTENGETEPVLLKM
jgi:hypothetical protein